ncbi:Eaa protein [Salmonella enterica]|uniref:Eaa protein n=1 Tax=Salmonella enterica TaxID=28901 RepID=A0A5T3EJQ8_SALER|nr:Eaa protein [Salmonella enterica subsp. enterica serovar Javiana]EAN2043057.1 Eaa protein [Salmonella enterica]EBC2493963.1 Eaa protein [Salmonella enterica subsp. enterica serovar Newport]EDV5429899.1 Eaa protein [Salmonella enterica subsp. enterica]EEN6799961.1 Eaa protein [Salmonella enterica subsp. enterica serovar Arechavaleta]
MTTITKERLLKIQQWRETYGADSNVMLPAEEAEELARIALASLEAEPVAWTSEGALAEVYCGETGVIGPKYIVGDVSLYRHAQPVPVDKEFIPKNLDKALGVVGVALPESKEEFNFQTERWIQRLIDRVIRYADEFEEQPAPVVPPAIEPDYKVIKSILPTANPDEYACCIAADMWNSCRSAMLNGGKS